MSASSKAIQSALTQPARPGSPSRRQRRGIGPVGSHRAGGAQDYSRRPAASRPQRSRGAAPQKTSTPSTGGRSNAKAWSCGSRSRCPSRATEVWRFFADLDQVDALHARRAADQADARRPRRGRGQRQARPDRQRVPRRARRRARRHRLPRRRARRGPRRQEPVQRARDHHLHGRCARPRPRRRSTSRSSSC